MPLNVPSAAAVDIFWGEEVHCQEKTAATSGVMHYGVHYSLASEQGTGGEGGIRYFSKFGFPLRPPLFSGLPRMQCTKCIE